MSPSADAWLAAITTLLLLAGGGVLRLLVSVARLETLVRAHVGDVRAHLPDEPVSRRVPAARGAHRALP
jgi:hypothetical protein